MREEVCAAVLDELLYKARKDGGPMNEIVATMASLGQVERENMFKWFGEIMPLEIGLARRKFGIFGVEWTMEQRMEEDARGADE